jgi:hypothetical protein
MVFLISLYFLTTPVPGAAEAINFIQQDVKVVIEFATNWSVRVALGVTSIHAFIVLCKRFLG